MRKLIFIFPVLFALICANGSLAATIHVPEDYVTIQAGIDAAVFGDTVLVASGTYTGDGNMDLDFHGKAITLTSENGPELTVVDCEYNGRGFYFTNGEGADSILEGLTIRNGYASGFGGGIYCDDSSPAIANCTVTDNKAGHGGGIGCADNSSPTIVNCTITGNGDSGGGGIECLNPTLFIPHLKSH